MTMVKNLVLTDAQIRQKIRRVAYQIFENNFHEIEIVLAGIDGQGYGLAELIGKELGTIASLKVTLAKIVIDKQSPQKSEVQVDTSSGDLAKKVIVLIDDVLNTGRTLAYAMKPFLSIDVKKIEVAVLVNRSNPLFPIQPNYTGYDLSTTMADHVEVVLGKKSAVYLH